MPESLENFGRITRRRNGSASVEVRVEREQEKKTKKAKEHANVKTKVQHTCDTCIPYVRIRSAFFCFKNIIHF